MRTDRDYECRCWERECLYWSATCPDCAAEYNVSDCTKDHPGRCTECDGARAVESFRYRAKVQRILGVHPGDNCPCVFCKQADRDDNRSVYTGGMD